MQMAQRNSLGFADVVVKQMTANQVTPSTADMLAVRDGSKSLIPIGMPLNKPVLPMSLEGKEQTGMPLIKQVIKSLPANMNLPMAPGRIEP
jgi:Rod binding domain-containing protein